MNIPEIQELFSKSPKRPQTFENICRTSSNQPRKTKVWCGNNNNNKYRNSKILCRAFETIPLIIIVKKYIEIAKSFVEPTGPFLPIH